MRQETVLYKLEGEVFKVSGTQDIGVGNKEFTI
jgi:hypothetical protein